MEECNSQWRALKGKGRKEKRHFGRLDKTMLGVSIVFTHNVDDLLVVDCYTNPLCK